MKLCALRRPQKVGFVSLGCPKNLVDSEVMMGMLARAGAELTRRAEDADVIVVNTCSFIDSAQQESVNTILEMAAHKTGGTSEKTGRRRMPGRTISRSDSARTFPKSTRWSEPANWKIFSPQPDWHQRLPPRRTIHLCRPALSSRRRRPRRARPLLPRIMGRMQSPTCPIIFTTTTLRASSPRPATWPTSRLPKAAIIPAPFASFRNCAGSFVRAASNP